MDLSLFDYDLPDELIAQRPAERRDASRLLVLDRRDGNIEHRRFYDIPEYLDTGDVLVLNDSKVIHARLFGVKETGAKIELLLIKDLKYPKEIVWEALAKPAKKMRPGDKLIISTGLKAEVVEKTASGSVVLRFFCAGNFDDLLNSEGKMPLPPYIRRSADIADEERYQTVYSKEPGSVAAPTAGLHFTEELLGQLSAKGIQNRFVTLHVGAGTFKPVQTDNIEDHHMHSEDFFISDDTCKVVNEARKERRRVICVGTTSVRTLESAAGSIGHGEYELRPGHGSTDIFIYPGYQYRICDALITNFHLPKSTLLMLVSAFAGREMILSAYEEAVREGYRFFSYGDAMLII